MAPSKVGIPSDQLERGQDSSGDDDIDGIVVIMKGVQETDQVSVFIVKGADGMEQVSSHVTGGTKCGHERQPDGSCLITDIATVDDDADNVSLADRVEEIADNTEQSVQATPGL